jgi:hypothetical protein
LRLPCGRKRYCRWRSPHFKSRASRESAAHPFARLKAIPLETVAAEPLVGLRRKDYPEDDRILDRVFAPRLAKPCIPVECDGASSLILRRS